MNITTLATYDEGSGLVVTVTPNYLQALQVLRENFAAWDDDVDDADLVEFVESQGIVVDIVEHDVEEV